MRMVFFTLDQKFEQSENEPNFVKKLNFMVETERLIVLINLIC